MSDSRALGSGNNASTVEDVMTRGVVAAHELAPFKEIVHALTRNGVSAVPVIDEHRVVIGMVSASDLLTHVVTYGRNPLDRSGLGAMRQRHRKANAVTAAALMSSPAVTVSPDATVAEAARLAARARVRRLPVVDAGGTLIGIISRSDLLKPFLRDDEAIRTDVAQGLIADRLLLDPHTIAVTVFEGVVTLSGEVDSRALRAELVAFSRDIAGVVAVEDDLTYVRDTGPAPVTAT
jgi:CBS domain-containing protein